MAERDKSLNALVADQLRPYLKPGQKVIWREPFRWHDDDGVISNAYEGHSVQQVADDNGWDVIWGYDMKHAALVVVTRPVTQDAANG